MKKFRLRLLVYLGLFICIAGMLSFSCMNYWKQIYINKQEKARLESEYSALVDDEETLANSVIKLQDPEYAAKYAREQYLYSKDGEIIIKIVDENE